MSESPLISVIIPTYNYAPFLPEALDSIIAQAYSPLEIIVVDDGSTDDTAVVIARYQAHLGEMLRFVRRDAPSSPAAARNAGLEIANGSLIAFLDADDVWTPNCLRDQLAMFSLFPQVGTVMGTLRFWRMFNPAEPSLSPPSVVTQLGAMLVKREVMDQVGGFDIDFRTSEDIDWFLRIREVGVLVALGAHVVLHYRQHNSNLSRDRNAGGRRSFALALQKSTDRRRQPDGSILPLPELFYMDPVLKAAGQYLTVGRV
ncbi:MAG: glycosyltransferase family A protein [Chloroflexota bacterium]|nr:glycosyltransferase family A protein [Chloroflexota bacterium]